MKKGISGIDWGLMFPVVVLVILSLTALFSINFSLFKSQMFFLIISVLAFLIFSQINSKIIQQYCAPIYILSLVLFSLVLILGIESRGSVRWFEIFGFRFQFSELLKPLLAVSLSSFLANRQNHSLKMFLRIILFLFPVAFLIFLQPDLGNTIIYFMVTILVLIIFGFPLRFFVLGFLFISVFIPILWKFLHVYQRERILSFLNPTDTLGISYNAIQSSIAIGSGMLTGRGLGQGTQSGLRFLPENHTDFIFATLSEGLGFIGAAVVIIAFGYLLYRIFLVYSNAQDSFGKIFSGVAFCLILSQFFINIGMNIGMLPIVGVTLPFVSYGGSSLLSSFILLGLLSSVNKKSHNHIVLEIK